ncbi:hypothetical protein Bca4012_073571 [Brassica carinata]
MKFIHHGHHLLFSSRERQGGELKSVDMLLLDVKTRWPQSSRATAEPSPEESFRFCKYESHVICQILLERLGASKPCKTKTPRALNASWQQ